MGLSFNFLAWFFVLMLVHGFFKPIFFPFIRRFRWLLNFSCDRDLVSFTVEINKYKIRREVIQCSVGAQMRKKGRRRQQKAWRKKPGRAEACFRHSFFIFRAGRRNFHV